MPTGWSLSAQSRFRTRSRLAAATAVQESARAPVAGVLRNGCRGPAVLATRQSVTAGDPHPTAEPVPKPASRTSVLLTGCATCVPFTAVLTGPQRIATDNTTSRVTCAAHPVPR
jgi:hypothetical protein